jgi:DNA-binding MarR family transcriptional regulator
LTLPQFVVLNHFVRLGGEHSPVDLARAMQVTKATMTSTLQRLAAKRLVAIKPDPFDGRGKRVSLTAKGRSARDEAVAAIIPDLGATERAFGSARFEAILPHLSALRAILDLQRAGTGGEMD